MRRTRMSRLISEDTPPFQRQRGSPTPLHLHLPRYGTSTSLTPARPHPPRLPANSASMVTPHQPATSLVLFGPTARALPNPPKFCRSSHSLTLSEFRRRQVLPTARKPPTRCPTTRYPASHAALRPAPALAPRHLPATAASTGGYTSSDAPTPLSDGCTSSDAPTPASTPPPCLLQHPRPRPPGSRASPTLRPRPTAPRDRRRLLTCHLTPRHPSPLRHRPPP